MFAVVMATIVKKVSVKRVENGRVQAKMQEIREWKKSFVVYYYSLDLLWSNNLQMLIK